MADKPPKATYEDRGEQGARLFSPSAGRNRDAIAVVYAREMPTTGRILELGSGTGEHAVHIAAVLPHLHWYPSEFDAAARVSIEAWRQHTELANVHPVRAINAASDDWAISDISPLDGMMSANMIHIAPWAVSEGLFAGASRYLAPKGRLMLYGPFRRDGSHTAESNAGFDESLRSRNPQWGVRDLDQDILPLAQQNRMALRSVTDMPANNLSIVFETA